MMKQCFARLGSIIAVIPLFALPAVGQADWTFTTVDFPGSTDTFARDINNRGEVIGGYALGGVQHGFQLARGEYTTIDFPGAVATTPSGINSRGVIVGFYISAGVEHGFLLSHGTFTTIDIPESTSTAALGINDRDE